MAGFLSALPGAISQGLIWGIMAIGVYITYKILDIADLTVDGSFCTGGAVFVMLFTNGVNVWLALLAALLAGMLAGLVTGLFHTVCGIPAILAGILSQLGLYSVNMAIMNFLASVSLPLSQDEVLNKLLVSLRFVNGGYPIWRHPIVVVGLFTAALIGILYWFFGTEMGAALRATGSNPNMARAQGINTNWAKVLGLVISNGLVALSGALLCQYNGGNEINVGRGAIVIGLAAVIIGEVLLGKVFRNFALKLFSVSIGAIIYYTVITAVLKLGLNPNYLKLLTALVVALFLTIPYWKGKYFTKAVKPGQKEDKANA